MPDLVESISKLLSSSGNTYISEEKLRSKKIKQAQLSSGLCSGRVVLQSKNGVNYYTLPYIKQMEKSIAKNIVAHVHKPNLLPDLTSDEIDLLINEFEAKTSASLGFKFAFHEEQRNAIHMATNSHMCIITGGPGTGKTSVINGIRYVKMNRPRPEPPHLLFTAPTGKAARRITESVGVPSKTVQKQIGANDFKDTPNIISADTMVVDEISMLDTVTIYQLMRAIDDDMMLILVGDVDQLPSVGIGSVLRDLIDSTVIPVTKLEKTFRQGAETCLAKNIAYLRKGYVELEQGDDFSVIEDFDDSQIVKELLDAVMKSYQKYGKEGVILLTPYRRKGSTCANEMNKVLQNLLNPSRIQVKTTLIDEDEDGETYSIDVCFRAGDPVMQLENREDCPIANGDVGRVEEIYSDNSIYVDFGHYSKLYNRDELKQLNLAYAMSIHKSQGSEYPCVITCALPEHQQLLNRNMIYTAVTRAKKECIIYCKKAVLKSSLCIEGGYIRDTFLCEEIQKEERKYQLIQSTVA